MQSLQVVGWGQTRRLRRRVDLNWSWRISLLRITYLGVSPPSGLLEGEVDVGGTGDVDVGRGVLVDDEAIVVRVYGVVGGYTQATKMVLTDHEYRAILLMKTTGASRKGLCRFFVLN